MEPALLRRLDFAVAECGFHGVRIAPDASAAFAMLTVLALPEVGAIDTDGRRYLHFGGVSTLEFSRRDDDPASDVPALLPLASPHDVETLLDDAQSVDRHGGFDHFDIPDPAPRLLAEPGLRLGPGPVRAGHSWHWGADVREADGRRTVVDVGIWFTDLAVERFDHTPLPVELFADDGYRWWTALRAGDPRVDVQAQRAAGLPGVIVPGEPPVSAAAVRRTLRPSRPWRPRRRGTDRRTR